MRAIELIRWALTMTDEGVAGIVKDLRDAPLTRPVVRDGVKSGNHPLWVLGHLAFLEGVLYSCVTGEENPVAHWAGKFGTGTTPVDDAGAYPSFDELLGKFRELRGANVKLLERIGEEGLGARPRVVPPGFEEPMSSVGKAFLLIALHSMVHYGQVADARRAAGLRPLI